MNSYGLYTFVGKKVGHEVRMALRAAESDAAVTTMLAELLKRVPRSRLGCDCCREFGYVELRIPPRDVAVIDIISNTKIVKRAEPLGVNSITYICLEHQVFLTECQEVSAIGAVRSCS